jgi:cytochrome c-type biogenesis protein CcmH
MAALWFCIGALSMLAALFALLPWLRSWPRLAALPSIPWSLSAAAAALLAVGVGMYVWLGRPDSANSAATPVAHAGPAASSSAAAGSAAAGSMSSAIASLQARLAKGGGSADDWELLAKAYEFVGQSDAAAQARAHQLPPEPTPSVRSSAALTASMLGAAGLNTTASAPAAPQLSAASVKLLGQADAARRHKHLKEALAIYAQLAAADQLNADGWADYADTAATVRGNRLAGEPEQYIARALALNPRHAKALWLQASADEEAGRLTHAIATWRELQGVLAPDSPDAKIVAVNLQQDQRLVDSAGAAGSAGSFEAAPASGPIVRGQVSLSPALRSRLSGGETLFIVAKSVDAPGPPVAVVRTSATAWPVTFSLDDTQAMMPGRNLSSAARVTVEARLSRTGQALPMSGDLAGSSAVIDPKATQPLAIVIDRVVP